MLPPLARQPRMLPQSFCALSTIHDVRLQETKHIPTEADRLC